MRYLVKVIFFLVSFLYLNTAYSCEPPPQIGGNCSSSKQFKNNFKITKKLLGELSSYLNLLDRSVKKDSPAIYHNRKGDSSCFLYSHALSGLKELKDQWKVKNNKICEFDLDWIISSANKTISKNAEELKFVKNEKDLRKLKSKRMTSKKWIEKFKKVHKQHYKK